MESDWRAVCKVRGALPRADEAAVGVRSEQTDHGQSCGAAPVFQGGPGAVYQGHDAHVSGKMQIDRATLHSADTMKHPMGYLNILLSDTVNVFNQQKINYP